MTSNLYPFEKRIVEAERMDMDVHEVKFESGLKGICVGNVIAIDKNLSWREKNCILTEEIGHALINSGDITDQSFLVNRKQEKLAKSYAYEERVPLDKLIDAFEYGCANRYEVAERLDITEEFFNEAMRYYLEEYGCFIEKDEYIIYFNDNSVRIARKSYLSKHSG